MFRIIISVLFLATAFSFKAQTTDYAFNFECKWGIFGHEIVSSKYEKVYVKVQHPDQYEGDTINFTWEEKLKVWNKLNEIDFFSYPEYYSPKPPKDTTPPYEVLHIETLLLFDSITGELEDPIVEPPDTLWNIRPIYSVRETSTPYSEYHIKVYFLGKEKTVRWRGSLEIIELGNRDKTIIDPKYSALFEMEYCIYKIIKDKPGYKEKPKSWLEYE